VRFAKVGCLSPVVFFLVIFNFFFVFLFLQFPCSCCDPLFSIRLPCSFFPSRFFCAFFDLSFVEDFPHQITPDFHQFLVVSLGVCRFYAFCDYLFFTKHGGLVARGRIFCFFFFFTLFTQLFWRYKF